MPCAVQMEAYRLYTVVPRLVEMIEQLTNWYTRPPLHDSYTARTPSHAHAHPTTHTHTA
jgi:hypothetical protein